MNKTYIIVFILLAAILAGGYYYLRMNSMVNEPNLVEDEMKTFSSQEYGISFRYQKNYLLVEKELGNGERIRHLIMLIEDTQENRDVLAGKSPGREWPVAITVDIFQNNLDKYTAEKWIKDTSFSNFKQSDGKLSPVSLDGKEAFLYKWSGLYEADNIVVATEKFVYSIAATYIAPEDQIRKNFLTILGTMEIE